MWLLFARAPPPVAPYWPGRRWLAAIDAVAWPVLVCVGLAQLASSDGLLSAFAMALSALSAARRLFTALLANHRYHFTAWRLVRTLAWMLAVGALLKLALRA